LLLHRAQHTVEGIDGLFDDMEPVNHLNLIAKDLMDR